jgi:hypothetical protein
MLNLSRLGRARTPALVVGAVVVTATLTTTGVASAAAKYVLLGAKNSTATTTTLTNTAKGGVPLTLNAGKKAAPLAVNSSVVVPKLNADLLDGLHAASFASAKGKSGFVSGSNGGGGGIATATCPKGTIMTGGTGLGVNLQNEWVPLASFPSSADTWKTQPTGGMAVAMVFVMCYNPKGAFPTGSKTAAAEVERLLRR